MYLGTDLAETTKHQRREIQLSSWLFEHRRGKRRPPQDERSRIGRSDRQGFSENNVEMRRPRKALRLGLFLATSAKNDRGLAFPETEFAGRLALRDEKTVDIEVRPRTQKDFFLDACPGSFDGFGGFFALDTEVQSAAEAVFLRSTVEAVNARLEGERRGEGLRRMGG